MSDPLRSKLKTLAYVALALALSLGLASALRSFNTSEAAPVAVAQAVTLPDAQTTAEPAATAQQEPVVASNFRALADVSEAFVAIARSVTPAVVSVEIRGTPRTTRLPRAFEDLFGPWHPQPEGDQPQYDVPLGRGSGFIVSTDGYIITNNHVVASAEKIDVGLPDGRTFHAKLVGRDPTTDIAVLKIDAKNLPAVTLGDPDATAVGEFVMAIGNPGTFGSDLPFTVTAGIVSAKGRDLEIIRRTAGDESRSYAIEDFIQTDAVINPGNSGGPLVNYRGQVIGVNTAIQSTTGFYQGYGFAIPISLAKDVMEDLTEYGRVRRAALRVYVQPVSAADVRVFKLPAPRGAVVHDFPESSPAEKAGITRGDVIVAINDKPVERVGQLQRTVASFEPGERVKVKVIRYGQTLSFDVKLAEASVPQAEAAPVEVASRPGNALIGIQVSDLTPALAEQFNLSTRSDLAGVIVTDVARFGPAASAGLAQGWLIQSVNGQSVRSVRDFDRTLRDVKPGGVVSLNAVAAGPDGSLAHRIINIEIPQD